MFKFDLPYKVSSNDIYSGIHFSTRNKYKNDMVSCCSFLSDFKAIENKIDINLTFYFKSHPLDSDNCSFMGKMIIDSLVKYKVINNDDIRYVRRVSYESIKSDNKTDYVEVEITEI